MKRCARLLSVGTATPPGKLSQAVSAEHALSIRVSTAPNEDQAAARPRAVEALYHRAGVSTRGTVLGSDRSALEAFYPSGASPSTSDRLQKYREHAGPLAVNAARDAIESAGGDPRSITHLVTVSCTGFDAPGIDHELIRDLGLPHSVRRTHVGFMGCHAAINALAVAAAFACEAPNRRVLVCCVELCSLHFSYSMKPERSVANALFADGAAAAVVAGPEDPTPNPLGYLAAFGSTVIPESSDLMAWNIGDEGFEMTLSPQVPEKLKSSIPLWMRGFLEASGITTDEIRAWAIHPGGPRVLSAVGESLGLDHEDLRFSREILDTHGNMSSATVLFIIRQMLTQNIETAKPIVAMAFGPGLAGEVMLIR